MESDLKIEDFVLEKLPYERPIMSELKSLEEWSHNLDEDEIFERLESILLSKIENNDESAPFILGQLNFEYGKYDQAKKFFKYAVKQYNDLQAKFQLSVMKFDGINCKMDMEKGVKLMKEIIEDIGDDTSYKHIFHPAAFNIGLAYYLGYGVKQSHETAEQWWIIAADDGNPKACTRAQLFLGYYYCNPDHLDLKKAFFWFTEACGNGSLEAQGALGVMYSLGLGTEKNEDYAFECLKGASERGNIYAAGHLVQYYYKKRLYTKTTQLAVKLNETTDLETVARTTGCLQTYIRKGLSLSCFIMGRCLQKGLGVQIDAVEAKKYFSKSFQWDPDMCAKLNNCVCKSEL